MMHAGADGLEESAAVGAVFAARGHRPRRMRDDDQLLRRIDLDGLAEDTAAAESVIAREPPLIAVLAIGRRRRGGILHPAVGENGGAVGKDAIGEREEADARVVAERRAHAAAAVLGAEPAGRDPV